MPGVGNDDVFDLGPGTGELVSAADRANHVIAALYDDPRQMANMPHSGDQIALADEKVVAEKMRLDARQTQSQPLLAKGGDSLGVRQQSRTGTLISTPSARRRHIDARVRIEQTAVIGIKDIAALA